MSHRLGLALQGVHLAKLGWVAPYVALGVTAGSLYVVSLNHPATRQVVAAAVVLACSVLAVVLRRFRPALIVLPALAGGVAVAVTSRDFFSYWPAACALLVTSAIAQSEREPERPHAPLPFVAATAGAAGLAAAALGPDAQLVAPMVPVAVAAVAIILLRPLASWVARTRELEERAAQYQHRAEASEAANLELERRTTLARELHDSLGHHVTAMVVQAEAGRVDQADAALAAIADLGREALNELEAVLFDLRGHPAESIGATDIDLGRIDTRLAQPLRLQGVGVHVEIDTGESDPARLAAVYRIAQEALTNTMRHADATQVRVLVGDEAGDLVVRVQDDGTGLPAEAPRDNGLCGIRERAAQFGGEATFVNVEPHGTLVQVRIPCTPGTQG